MSDDDVADSCCGSCLGSRVRGPRCNRQTDRHAHHNTPLPEAAIWGLVIVADVLCDRQTDRQRDRHAHHNTPLPAAAVWGLVLCCPRYCVTDRQTDRETDMLITILRYLRQLSGAS